MSLNILAIPCAILAVLGEAMAAKQIMASVKDPAIGFWSIYQYHIGALVVGWPAFWNAFPEDYKQHRVTLTALIFGFSLPFPIVGPLFLIGFRIIIRRDADFDESNFVVGTQQFLTLPKEEELVSESPRSVAQILNSNDRETRRAAILALRIVEPKKALPLLQKAIQDSDEQVRLLAQTMFSQILANLESEVKNLEAELVDNPHWNRQLLLAEQYHELVYLGLATDETETIYLDRAIQLLEAAEESSPENTSISFLMMKCLLRNGHYAKAKQKIQHLESRGWRSEITLPWLAEVFFLERDWRSMLTILDQMDKSDFTAPVLRAPITFWESSIRSLIPHA